MNQQDKWIARIILLTLFCAIIFIVSNCTNNSYNTYNTLPESVQPIAPEEEDEIIYFPEDFFDYFPTPSEPEQDPVPHDWDNRPEYEI